MSIEYSRVDWQGPLEILVPGASFSGSYIHFNQSEYDEDITWTDGRTKPTWAQICQIWATRTIAQGGGVDMSIHAPGDIKRSAQTADHGDWLLVNASTGRVLNRVDYAALFYVVGTVWASDYPGIAGTDFGLPIPGGRVSIVANSTYPYGSKGGSDSRTLALANLPQHDHTLPSNIAIQQAGLTLFGYTNLLGTPGATIGASAKTGATGSASPTAINIMQPYMADGNLFVHRGTFKYPVYYS